MGKDEVRFAIRSGEFDASLRFWRDILGLTPVSLWDRPDGKGAIFAVGGNAFVEVLGAGDGPDYDLPPTTSVYLSLEMDDVDAVFGRFSEAGADVVGSPVDQPWGHRSFRVREPAGVEIQFFAPIDP